MAQDAYSRTLLTASVASLIFFLLQQGYWRAALRRASKSPADLPGGAWAFNIYQLAQASIYALTLAYIMMPIALYGYDWSNRDLWRNFTIALIFAMTVNLSVGCIARRVWPSIKSIDMALAALRKNGRPEKTVAK